MTFSTTYPKMSEMGIKFTSVEIFFEIDRKSLIDRIPDQVETPNLGQRTALESRSF